LHFNTKAPSHKAIISGEMPSTDNVNNSKKPALGQRKPPLKMVLPPGEHKGLNTAAIRKRN